MKWYLWACANCGSTMTINYVASEQDYNRFKACHCGSLLEYKKDMDGENDGSTNA